MSISLGPHKANPHPETGSLLIIVAVLLLLVGTAVSFGIGNLKTKDHIDRIQEAQQEMDFIIDQLASFVHRTRRLPAPDGATGVPTEELYISFRYQNDPWGNPYLYFVSPVFEQVPTDGTAGEDVFYTCRTQEWTSDSGGATVNESPYKAQFCCPDYHDALADDLQVDTDHDGTADDLIRSNEGPTAIGGAGAATEHDYYESINQEVKHNTLLAISDYIDATDPPVELPNIEAYAVVLISHGPNGTGTSAPPFTPDEDDMVVWRTQLSLYSELGGASCYGPWK